MPVATMPTPSASVTRVGSTRTGNHTPAQKAALIALLRSLKVDYPDAEIKGHCELKGVHKDCPCFSCQEYRDYFARLSHLAN